MIETVPCEHTVRCTVTQTVRPVCPHLDELDCYEVTVAWDTGPGTVEKHSLRSHLRSYNNEELSQEGLAATIAAKVRTLPVTGVTVSVEDTRHMDMEVTA